MSGTSLDGLDVACCYFSYLDGHWQYRIEAAACVDYSPAWKQRLQDAPLLSGIELMYLHKEYGGFIGEKLLEFVRKYNLQPDLISSHGHTVFHEPERKLSLQVGDGAAISALTRLPVVCDFRALDVCAGGQGAPLVPIGDKLLFGEYTFCLNLGGIANISYNEGEKRIAYDVSPCNLLLNRLAVEKGLEYDKGGELARKGSVNEDLLEKLNNWAFYKKPAPKSLDKEALLSELLPLLQQASIATEDKLATVVRHIAQQTGIAVRNKVGLSEADAMLVTGGGAFNTFLIEEMRKATGMNIIVPDELLVNYKEALVFAFLGLLRVQNEPNCLASVTGAAYDNIGGALYGDFSGLI